MDFVIEEDFAFNIPSSYIVNSMTKYISTYVIHPVGSLLAILFTVSLLWCGDADCWSGSSDDQCASLICSLFINHSGSSQDGNGDSSTDCTCVCHMPTIPIHAFGFEYDPPVFNRGIDIVATVPPSPTRPIYHPPLAG